MHLKKAVRLKAHQKDTEAKITQNKGSLAEATQKQGSQVEITKNKGSQAEATQKTNAVRLKSNTKQRQSG